MKESAIRLSTGREIYANLGILGLSPSGDLTQGYDGDACPRPSDDHDCFCDGCEECDDFTPEEKREIAAMMVERWRKWGGL